MLLFHLNLEPSATLLVCHQFLLTFHSNSFFNSSDFPFFNSFSKSLRSVHLVPSHPHLPFLAVYLQELICHFCHIILQHIPSYILELDCSQSESSLVYPLFVCFISSFCLWLTVNLVNNELIKIYSDVLLW